MKNKQKILNIHLLSLAVTAQSNQKWFRKELGVAQSSVYDNGHSLARYKGTGLQLQLGFDRETSKGFRQFDNTLVWTPLKAQVSDNKNVTSATQGNYKMSYKYLRNVTPSQNKIKVSVGASLFADANVRIYNSLVNNIFGWDVNLGLNVVGQATRDFKLGKHSLSASYQLGVPLVVYNHSPNYLGTVPVGKAFEQKNDTNWSSLGRLVTGLSNKYFYLHQQFSVEKHLSSGDRLRLTYSWDYSNNGYASHRYQNLITGVSIGMLTSFSKKRTANKTSQTTR